MAISLLVLLLLVPALSMLFTAGAEDPPEFDWGDDIKLSDSTEASDDATIALLPDGGMVVAWRERRLAQYSVFFAILDEEGDLVGDPQQLGEDLPASMDPVLAVDSDGGLHFVWTAMEDQELYYARASHDGTIELGPVRLTEATGDSAEASVWMDNRDHMHIVWFDGRDATTYLYYMQLDRDGNKVVEDTRLVRTYTEQESAVAMDSRGDLHVVWNSLAGPGQVQWNSEVHYTKLSSTGEVLVADRVIASSRGRIGFPDVAVDVANAVHVVWPEGLAVRESIMYAKLDSSGRTMVTRTVAEGGTEGAGDVAIGIDGNNRLHLAWSQGTTGSSELMYQPMDDEGLPLGDPVQLTEAAGDSRYPAIGLSTKGEPRVAWSDWRSGNAEIYLKVATLPVLGVDLAVYARDIVLDPPTVTAGEAFNVTITFHNQGDARVDLSDATVEVDGAVVYGGRLYNLGPGSSTDVTFHVTLDEGDHTISVEVQPWDVEDIAPHNNVAYRSVTAYPPGELVADAGPDTVAVAGRVTYLDASGTIYRGDGVLSYEWDLGDGTRGVEGEYIEHVYQSSGVYTATVRVSDGVVEDTDRCRVDVRQRDDPPRAVISPEGRVVGDRLGPVVLSAAGSSDDRGIANYTWEMGDGTVVSGQTASHTYSEPGIYPVTLTVQDTAGQVDINRTTVEVVNLPPDADAIKGPSRLEVGKKGSFGVSATDPDGQVDEVGWDFDPSDGITFEATGEEVAHKWDRAGTYNVTCIVRDDDGGQTVLHLEVRVVEEAGVDTSSMAVAVLLALVIIVVISIVLLKNRTKQE